MEENHSYSNDPSLPYFPITIITSLSMEMKDNCVFVQLTSVHVLLPFVANIKFIDSHRDTSLPL